MATAAQNLNAVRESLGLGSKATAEDILAAIEAREQAAKDSMRKSRRPEKWTPTISPDGEVRFAGTTVAIAADELDPLIETLGGEPFVAFLAENADSFRTREEVRAHKEKRLAERRSSASA